MFRFTTREGGCRTVCFPCVGAGAKRFAVGRGDHADRRQPSVLRGHRRDVSGGGDGKPDLYDALRWPGRRAQSRAPDLGEPGGDHLQRRGAQRRNLRPVARSDGGQRARPCNLAADRRRLRQSVLFDRATTAAYLGGAYIVDANGHVLASQDGELNPTVRLDDRDYFVVQQRNPAVGLFVSHPFRSRLRGGNLSIGLTRRINAQAVRLRVSHCWPSGSSTFNGCSTKSARAKRAPYLSCSTTAQCSRASRSKKAMSARASQVADVYPDGCA